MSNPSVLFRSLVTYGMCVPVALFLGYVLANPELLLVYRTQTILVGVLLMILVSPLFLKYHHPWLLASWNMSTVLFFLPGSPQLWMGLAGISLTIAVLQYILSRENRLLSAPSVTNSLIAIMIVTVATAYFTGGIGLRSLGSNVYGGKRYFMIVLSCLGYWAIVSRRIPPERAYFYSVLFFLGSGTMAIGNLAGHLPSQFNFLFMIFPVESLSFLSTSMSTSIMTRSWGLSLLGLGIFCAMLAKYGVTGILNIQHPLRLLVFTFFSFLGLMGGFRSVLVIYIMTFGLLMYLEGLLRTRMLPAIVLSVVLGGALMTAFATSLPLSVQRSLAFLPLNIDPLAKLDAQGSSEWRIRMWQSVLPEIPEYLLIGKGYLFSSTDEFLHRFKTAEESFKGSEMVGDYHDGPLSVILPFGLGGVFAFLWFMVAAAKVFHANYKYGDEHLRVLNRFLYAYFIARVIFFFAVFGSLYSDLALFTGLVGLSVSLNGGVSRPQAAPQPQFSFGRMGVGTHEPEVQGA